MTGLGRKIAAAAILAGGLCLVCGIFAFGVDSKSVTERDYIQYWAVGKLLRQGDNPYSLPAILAVEKSAGMEGNDPKASVGPPVALVLLAPLGFLSAKAGLIVWLVAELASVSLALWLVWVELGRPDSRIHLLGYLFPPILAQRDAIFPALFAAVAALIVVSFVTPKPSAEQLAKFAD